MTCVHALKKYKQIADVSKLLDYQLRVRMVYVSMLKALIFKSYAQDIGVLIQGKLGYYKLTHISKTLLKKTVNVLNNNT